MSTFLLDWITRTKYFIRIFVCATVSDLSSILTERNFKMYSELSYNFKIKTRSKQRSHWKTRSKIKFWDQDHCLLWNCCEIHINKFSDYYLMMSASMPQCTPAEIAEKRRIALGIAEERKKQNRLKRRLEQNNENRLSLHRNNSEQSNSNTTKIGTSSSTSEPTSGLTDQQKAAIEFNRQEAIKNLLSKKFISNRAATELLSKNVHQVPSPLATSSNAAKLNSVQVKSSNQSLGKSVAPSRTQIIEARKKPYQQQLPSYGKRISVNCKVEFITEDRFEVRMDNFNETIVNEFKKVSSKAFSKWFLFKIKWLDD